MGKLKEELQEFLKGGGVDITNFRHRNLIIFGIRKGPNLFLTEDNHKYHLRTLGLSNGTYTTIVIDRRRRTQYNHESIHPTHIRRRQTLREAADFHFQCLLKYIISSKN